jgi:hypothetical protein
MGIARSARMSQVTVAINKMVGTACDVASERNGGSKKRAAAAPAPEFGSSPQSRNSLCMIQCSRCTGICNAKWTSRCQNTKCNRADAAANKGLSVELIFADISQIRTDNGQFQVKSTNDEPKRLANLQQDRESEARKLTGMQRAMM